MSSFWYLASPYSKYPPGMDQACIDVCKAAGKLVNNGIPVFSPIAHSHAVAEHGSVAHDCYDTWLAQDEVFMRQSCGMIVLMLDGWDESDGVAWEIEWMRNNDKPILYMEP